MDVQATIQVDVTPLNDQQRRRLFHMIETYREEISADQGAIVEATGWTSETLASLLARLVTEGWTAQADAIKLAASHDGVVSRAEVYELAGYEETRSLKGFTRPVTRIAEELKAAGVVPGDAGTVLEPVYDDAISGYQKAGGFKVPAGVVGLLA